MLYRHLSFRIWTTSIGSFNPSLSKGLISTTWLWNLHSTFHDFAMTATGPRPTFNHQRKVISSGVAHISTILLWISGMLFHGSYFSNYTEWLIDPTHVKPSAHFVWSLTAQDILNSDVGGYFQGIYVTSGLFQVWRSQGR